MQSFKLDLEVPESLSGTLDYLMDVLPFADQSSLVWFDQLCTVHYVHNTEHLYSWIIRSRQDHLVCLCDVWLFPGVFATHLRVHLRFDGAAPLTIAFDDFVRSLELQLNQMLALHQPVVAPRDALSHPLTWQAFEQMNALEQLQRIQALDTRWKCFEQGERPPLAHSVVDQLPGASQYYDLIYAGGGLGLIHAVLMARQGYQVLVFDRYEVGCAHREWNISHAELQRLVDLGFIDWATLESSIIMRRYTDGVVRFYPDGSLVEAAEIRLPTVLNIALDAGALLGYARQQLLATENATIAEGWQFTHVFASKQLDQVVVQVSVPDDDIYVSARLMIDAMGATSPLTLATQPFEGICPTVGTVVTGLADHDPDLGDILISIADTQRGKQLIWEGFPGRDDELTVYVFYYDQVGSKAQYDHSLLDLFEDYFQLVQSYKQPGPEFVHLRPLYGYIPGRHALDRPIPLKGVLPIGDASAQQSPLTFCGFGSFIRNLQRTTEGLSYALQHGLLQPIHLRQITAYQANVSMNWVFSRFMTPWSQPHDVNQLQNVFAQVLNQLGSDTAQRFFQDQMTWGDYRRVVLGTLDVYPAIMRTAWDVLGPQDVYYWVMDWLRFTRSACMARLFGGIAPRFVRITDWLYPAWGLRLRSTLAEWQAMGWIPS